MTGQEQVTALEMLERTWYPEPSVLAALHQQANVGEAEVRTGAKQLIKRWQEIAPTTIQ